MKCHRLREEETQKVHRHHNLRCPVSLRAAAGNDEHGLLYRAAG